MKKAKRTFFSILLIFCLSMSLSSCSLFATMREYSRKASEIPIIPTPENGALFEEFDKAVEKSVSEAVKLSCTAEYKVKDIKVTGQNGNIDILNKAAKTLTALIMSNKPGAESRETETVSLAGTMLENFGNACSISYTVSRNEINEPVTNEKGEEMTDESGAVIKEPKIKDNFLSYAFCFYSDTVTQEAYTDENGNDVAAVTERSYASRASIEQVFGQPKDKEEVLAGFNSIKDYFTVNEYTYEYGSCKVSGQLELDTQRLDNADFEKEMLITAIVTGKGVFEEYGKLTVTFSLIRTDSYSFTFPEAEE